MFSILLAPHQVSLCPLSDDNPLHSGYYGYLSISNPDDPTPTKGEDSKDNTLVIVQYYCYSIS